MVPSGSKVEAAMNREWRCTCGSLLGMRQGEELHIKYKELHAVVRGTASIRCRRCGNNNVTAAPSKAAA